MRTRTIRFALPIAALVLVASIALAQRWSRSYSGGGIRTAREAEQNSVPTPDWRYDEEFQKDVFTFARIRYSQGYSGFGRRRGGRGAGPYTDFPDSDLNLSFRLQQMTAIKVDPDCRVLDLTDDDLYQFPWIYIVEPGSLSFEEREVTKLRNYLLNGGFLMVDDFWGDEEWFNFEDEMSRVFPDREFVELSLDHPIYNCVFPINAKLQIPNVRTGVYSQYDGVTWEPGLNTREVHHRAIFDDQGRIMVIAFHNTDNGDGWEREGEDPYYFRHFAEKIAYPMGINTIFYAMTH